MNNPFLRNLLYIETLVLSSKVLTPNGQFLAQKSYGCKEFANHELLAHVCNQSSSNSVYISLEFYQKRLATDSEMCLWYWQSSSKLFYISFEFKRNEEHLVTAQRCVTGADRSNPTYFIFYSSFKRNLGNFECLCHFACYDSQTKIYFEKRL